MFELAHELGRSVEWVGELAASEFHEWQQYFALKKG